MKKSIDALFLPADGQIINVNLPGEAAAFNECVCQLLGAETYDCLRTRIDGVLMLVDDNGKLNRCRYNAIATDLYGVLADCIVGDAVLVCAGEDDFTSIGKHERKAIYDALGWNGGIFDGEF